MNFIRINSTNAEIGIKTTQAKLRIRQPLPKLSIKQRPPEMIIKRTPPKLVIDQTKAFADMGNKTIFRLMDEFAKMSFEMSKEAIARIAAEGTKISKGGKNRGEIARQIIYDKMVQGKGEVNVAALPREGPEIKWEDGHFEISWVIHPPEVEWEISARAEIEVDPHSVEIYTIKHPTFKIELVEKGHKSGEKINRKI